MTSAIHRPPEAVSAQELDSYLARGWYRVGSALLSARYYLHEDEVYSTIWTRLPLDGWRLRRGQRRRVSRMSRRFEIRLLPFVLSSEYEVLYRRYLEVAPGDRSETLVDFLGGIQGMGLYQTRVVEFRQQGVLRGFSLYDLGAEAVQSLVGVYDPEMARFGLGAHSMLLEALDARDRGCRFHYSGYVVPGARFMDYKWALSEDMEFLHPELNRWMHRRDFGVLETPDVRLKRRLRQAARALARRQLAVGWRLNDLFAAPHMHESLAKCLAEPLVLVLPGTRTGQPLIIWQDSLAEFQLLRGVPVQVQRTFAGDPESVTDERTWLVEEVLYAGLDLEQLVDQVESLYRR